MDTQSSRWWNHRKLFQGLDLYVEFSPTENQMTMLILTWITEWNTLTHFGKNCLKLVHEYEQTALKMKNTMWWTELTFWDIMCCFPLRQGAGSEGRQGTPGSPAHQRCNFMSSPLHSFIPLPFFSSDWKQMQQTSVPQRKKKNQFSNTSIFLSLV